MWSVRFAGWFVNLNRFSCAIFCVCQRGYILVGNFEWGCVTTYDVFTSLFNVRESTRHSLSVIWLTMIDIFGQQYQPKNYYFASRGAFLKCHKSLQSASIVNGRTKINYTYCCSIPGGYLLATVISKDTHSFYPWQSATKFSLTSNSENIATQRKQHTWKIKR